MKALASNRSDDLRVSWPEVRSLLFWVWGMSRCTVGEEEPVFRQQSELTEQSPAFGPTRWGKTCLRKKPKERKLVSREISDNIISVSRRSRA